MLRTVNDIASVMSSAFENGGAVLLTEAELGPEFFALRSRLAGELFQKIMNYSLRLALVVPEPERYGDRFSELVYEHRSHGNIRFFRDQEQAEQWLAEYH